ncbi:MAG: AAA domain-containing protein, partial [Christensenellales bacterium]
RLINSEDISVLVNDLLENIQEENPIVKSEISQEQPFYETNINYINELNSSQEQAVLSASTEDRLVIQGPPGTGKSQTITSLIADSVNKGKSVLMVSQKKAALDVIYSRLGKLSNFAIMINDTKDKSNFYNQMHNLFACNKESSFEMKYFNELASNIDEDINKCEAIASNIFSQRINNTEIYKIYSSNENNFWLTCKDEKLFDTYFLQTQNDLCKVPYAELCNIHNKLNNEEKLKNLIEYVNILTKYPFVADIKSGLKLFDRKRMEKEFSLFEEKQKKFLELGFFKRLFGAGKRKREFSKLFNEFFTKTRYKNSLYKNLNRLIEGIKNYSYYDSNVDIVSSFNQNEKNYLKSIYNLSLNVNDNLNTINNNLLDFIIYCNLTDFEGKHRKEVATINNFDKITKNICTNMSDKIDLTKARMKDTLANAFYNEILLSKRYLEICRQIESNRKWSVSKFMKKFSFELLRGIKIWLMTPETVSELLPLEYGLFDTLIFDEASQIYIEKGLPSITRACNVVVAGDHKQLRPSSLGFGRIDIEDEELLTEDSDTNAALEEESLLDLARFKYPSVLLNYHYRSK